MAHGIPSQGKVTVTVDEYSSNPTQAFTHYNINQSRFQPPHVHMVDPIPYDTPKPAGHTRFVCVSDTHSRTDGIQMPYGDILLHTGDFTELGLPSEVKKFNDWLGSLPYEYKIVIAGNHELTFDKEFMADLVKQDYYRFPSVSKLKPEDFDNVQSLLTNSIYLQDSEITVKGFRIYGAPWFQRLGPKGVTTSWMCRTSQHCAKTSEAQTPCFRWNSRRLRDYDRWIHNVRQCLNVYSQLSTNQPSNYF
ncbi:metallophosphoesterase MPPED2 [Pelobates cultripes]|uniref:Metallophosphoesterase MPPED2 n=1 Tax=Pelobates cultripes TaxID=61616 RepID=A0AAD1TJJ2_PELCU|nr:metallophosphoesterase MPPED2 [Pelobates cultripes]